MSMNESYSDLSLQNEEVEPSPNACNPHQSESQTTSTHVQLFWRRWFILAIFSLFIILNVFNLTEYFDVEEAFIEFYTANFPSGDIQQFEISYWLTLVNLVCYILFIFPAMFLLELKGLSFSCMLGIFLTIFGSWIKCASVKMDMFPVLMFGQICCAIAQPFIQSPLVKLSSLWFGQRETATATAISILSSRVGAFLGCIIPPYVIETDKSLAVSMYVHFYYLYLVLGLLCSFGFIMGIFVIKDEPGIAPSTAQLKIRASKTAICPCEKSKHKLTTFKSFFKSMGLLLSDFNYVLILLSFGILVGAYYSISLHLSQTVAEYYTDESGNHRGFLNLLLIGSGIFGSITSGLLVDYTKSFKLLFVGVNCCVFVVMILFTSTIFISIWFPIICLVMLGFFMTALIPVGYEYAVELTYPISEGTSSSLLNASSIVFGIVFIIVQKLILSYWGAFYSNGFMCLILFIGLIISTFISNNLKRLNANKI